MKNIVKISISGLAFTLEEDGYILLDSYLAKLKNYYAKQQNGMEVVEGIEERIAELLRERMSGPEEVVNKELILEVMAIMGKPEDIEEGDTSEEQYHREREREQTNRAGRKLYRDGEDRILGGVCSGLAAYFNTDVILFRILFIVALFLGSFGFWLYLILWIVIPPARTVAQKCEMRGENPDFSGVQERVKRGAERVERGVRNAGRNFSRNMDGAGAEVVNGLGRILAFCVGLILVFISIPILIAIPISFIFSTSWIYGALPQGFIEIIAFNGNPIWIFVLAGLVFLLPFVGMLSGGIALIFRLRPRRFRPGPIIFICWLISLIALIVLLITATRPYYGGVEEARKEVPLSLKSDTLYVQYTGATDRSGPDFWIEANASQAHMGWFEGERQHLKAVIYPQIRIVRIDASEQMYLRLKGRAAGRYIEEAYTRAEETIPVYQVQDSLLTLSPRVYSHRDRWQANWSEAVVYLPQGKQVKLTSPYEHHFDRSAPKISKGLFWKWERRERRWERRWSH